MVSSILTNKKAQIWSIDLVVATVIFLIGIVIVYFYAINYSPQAVSELDELFHEGTFASKILLSEEDSGILSDNKINQTKLNNFNSIGYEAQKNALGIINEFYFVLEGMEIDGAPATHLGTLQDADSENLVKITRITIYKNKPTKLEFYTWR